METLALANWKLNGKQQIEMDVLGNRHLSREEVGKRVLLKAGGRDFEVRLFAIGLVFHGPGEKPTPAVKLKVTDDSKFSLEELVAELQAGVQASLVVQKPVSGEPARLFQKFQPPEGKA